MMNNTIEPLFNFNLLANNTFSTSMIDQKEDKSMMMMMMGNQRKHSEMNESQENRNSWSKLIENIQQNPSKQDKMAKNGTYNNINLQTLPN